MPPVRGQLLCLQGGMELPQFQLFRIKVIQGPQLDMYRGPVPPATIIAEAVRAQPSAELRRGHTGHLGNLMDIDSAGIYFAFGKTTSANVERFDADTHRFVSERFDTAPYTHVFLDYHIQVIAIAAKTRLSPSTAGIARQLQRLLNASSVAASYEAEFELAELKDPSDFIAQLRTAYAVSRFTFSFSRPNPFDVDRDFVGPMQSFVRATQGKSGQASVVGRSLSADVLEQVARSAAATGDDAIASVRRACDERPVRKRLRGNPVTMSVDDPESTDQKLGVFRKIRELYAQVREHIE